MARKVTEEAVQAFAQGYDFNQGNTRVDVMDEGIVFLRLHGHVIARRDANGVKVSNCGYETNVTKERINGVLSHYGVSGIYQKKGVWYWKDTENFPCDEMVAI